MYITDLPRLRVGSAWTEITVVSEVGVSPTSRGYVPALIVRRGDIDHVLLAGAQSLGQSLELLRLAEGQLAGLALSIRKASSDRSAPYEVQRTHA